MFGSGVTLGAFVQVKAGTVERVARAVRHIREVSTMGDYNGDALAIEAADALWTALQNMNLTSLDESYRPTVGLAWQATGTPYTAVLDALRAVLTVIVSVDPWATHATTH